MPARTLILRAVLAASLATLHLGSPVHAGNIAGRTAPASGTSGRSYLRSLARSTYDSMLAMVEPRTGLPHDSLNAILFDVFPQLGVARAIPRVDVAPEAALDATECSRGSCRRDGRYGLQLTYKMPSGKHGSYVVGVDGFDVTSAVYLEVWAKGARGGERFELVLWSDCQKPFPDRPASAVITARRGWRRYRVPLADYLPFGVDLASLCRLSVGFNDAIHPGGTVYVDRVAFVDTSGRRVPAPVDETTNVSNVGLYMASVVGAVELGLEDRDDAVAALQRTLKSLEALPGSHGFPHTHNHVSSLRPDLNTHPRERCRDENDPDVDPEEEEENLYSTVDLGNLAAGLVVVRQGLPELSRRAGKLLDAMRWGWLYDGAVGLPYGCRAWDGAASDWHNRVLAADARLAHFIGIGSGRIPAPSWGNLERILEPARCKNAAPDLWHYAPGWGGGGLFMQLLPGIFLDEADSEIGRSAHNFAEDQICYAEEIGAPAWGWSATALPPHGADYCGGTCQRDDILVPHAGILAAETFPARKIIRNLRKLAVLGARPAASDGLTKRDFGFRASIPWPEGEPTSRYLLLDQAMAFLSLVNRLADGHVRGLFCDDEITQRAIRRIPDYATSCQAAP